MLRLRNLICVLLFSISSYSQLDSLDDKYREDQIYFGVYYNSLADSPNDFSQNKFSSSVNLGFIRDFPLNKERNFGLGIGLGLSTSSYHNNLKFSNSNGLFNVAIISDSETFTKNKWALNELEFPFEIRWRTSSAENYKFWRIYFGIKTSYVFSSKHRLGTIILIHLILVGFSLSSLTNWLSLSFPWGEPVFSRV